MKLISPPVLQNNRYMVIVGSSIDANGAIMPDVQNNSWVAHDLGNGEFLVKAESPIGGSSRPITADIGRRLLKVGGA